MDLHDFYDGLQRFATAGSLEELAELCRGHSERLGFEAFIYVLRLPTRFAEARVIAIKGYPEPWLERYWEVGHYHHDPVVAHCTQHIVPVIWHELKPSADAQRVMDEASEFGLRYGVSMPVHSPQGDLGILSLALDRRLVAAREITLRAVPYVQMLAAYLHEAVRRVAAESGETTTAVLTDREKECMRWVADGKTSWEISQLLRMSERTVNFHLNNAMIKLDVRNRQHAIARAVLRGLINPHPF